MSTKREVRGMFGSLQLPETEPASLDSVLSSKASDGYVAAPLGSSRSKAPMYGPAPVSEAATMQAVRGVFGGLGAGGSTSPSYDATSAAVNIGTATATGAAAGAMYGGPVGAAAGAGFGFLTSGLQAWMQVSAENKRRSEMDALIREIRTKEEVRERRDRRDHLEGVRYERREAELQKAWGAAQMHRDRIGELVAGNQSLRDRWVQKGF